MTLRSRDTQAEYDKLLAESAGACSLCTLIAEPTSQVLTIYEHHLLIKNRFPYETWEDLRVTEHLMFIPKQHVKHFNDLGSEADDELGKLLANAEADGYSIYHRSQDNPARSMEHLHTHLFRLAL